jgi:hypothetical protein
MIVAQQFIAGGRLKRRVRPGRDDRSTVCAREVALEAKGNGSFVPSSFVILTMADRPGRTPLWAISQHFVLGFYEAQFVKTQRQKKVS